MQSTFLLTRTIETFFEPFDSVKNLEMTHIVWGGGSHVICINMTHCVQKSRFDSDLK